VDDSKYLLIEPYDICGRNLKDYLFFLFLKIALVCNFSLSLYVNFVGVFFSDKKKVSGKIGTSIVRYIY